MKLILTSIVGLVLTAVSLSASAIRICDRSDVICDSSWPGKYPISFLHEEWNPRAKYTHRLIVPEHYSIVRALLVVAFSDGYHRPDRAPEKFRIKADGIDHRYRGHMYGTHRRGFQYMPFIIGQAGIDTLNLTGELKVKIKALNTRCDSRSSHHSCANDFWWKKSFVIAQIEKVPEPGTLGMLGLGLLGIVAVRRMRKSS